MAKNIMRFPIGNIATPRKIGINGFNSTTAAGNWPKKKRPYRNALNNGNKYGTNATTRSGTGTMLNPPPAYPRATTVVVPRARVALLSLAATARVVLVVVVVVPARAVRRPVVRVSPIPTARAATLRPIARVCRLARAVVVRTAARVAVVAVVAVVIIPRFALYHDSPSTASLSRRAARVASARRFFRAFRRDATSRRSMPRAVAVVVVVDSMRSRAGRYANP